MREVYDLLGGYQAVNEFQAGFQGGALDPFIQGKVVMKIDGSWQMSGLPAYARDLDFGVTGPPLPKSELAKGRRTVSFNGGYASVIPSVAKHKDAAWEFVRFLASDRAFWIRRENERATAEAMGRLFIPRQAPVKDLNEASFEKYVYSNELIPQKYRDGCRVFNDLMAYARYRPVTPVGQRLWKAHVDATETGLLDDDKTRMAQGSEAIAKAALDRETATVQREINRFMNPPGGGEVSLTWFFVVYPIGLILFGAGLFLWDTNPRFRARVAKLFRLKTSGDAVIEGARGGYFRGQWWGGVVCALPWIIGFIVFAGGPMLFSIIMSFCDYDILNPPRFVGFGNYAEMFAEDGLFYAAFWNTVFMLIGVPLGMVTSLAIALLLNLKIRGVSIWRTFFYLPAIVPMVAASVMWVVIFNPQGGLINKFLELIGLEGPGWLQNASWSKPSLILMGLWSAGGGMLIWLAGLKGIPEQLYEAASVDGASAWQKFRHVTIPQLTPYIFFNLIMGFISTFQIFAAAFIMTEGGPRNSTLFFVYHLFNNAFRYGRMGYASALGWILFLIVLALTIVQLKLSKRWVYYESD
jgi:multiple sugar transport system permease protein